MTDITRITCLCGSVKQLGLVASPTLPVDSEYCHCNPCRQSSGVIAASFVPLKSRPDQIPATTSSGTVDEEASPLVGYASSSKLTRYFCRKCGSHCFIHTHDGDEWWACSGVVEHLDDSANAASRPDIVRIVRHEYVADTVDGGVAGRLTKIGGRTIPCFSEAARGFSPMANPPASPAPGVISNPPTGSSADKLQARCRCGGVEFNIARPSFTTSPSETDPESTWWVPNPPTRYLAGHCVCESCRLASGFPLQPWAYISISALSLPSGEPLTFSAGPRHECTNAGTTLQYFTKTPGVARHFCRRCGATVFWYDEHRKTETAPEDVIDVSVGLLRAEEGVRAESWLAWRWQRASWRAEALDREVVDAMVEG